MKMIYILYTEVLPSLTLLYVLAFYQQLLYQRYCSCIHIFDIQLLSFSTADGQKSKIKLATLDYHNFRKNVVLLGTTVKALLLVELNGKLYFLTSRIPRQNLASCSGVPSSSVIQELNISRKNYRDVIFVFFISLVVSLILGQVK